ncbi:MAG: hypothetical protein ABGX08_00005, partial [Citromicrobium sp.]
ALRTAADPEPADYGPGDKADCGHWNPIWFAGNPFWNEVMGGPDAKDDPGGVLCLTCFAKRAGDVVIRVSRVSEPAEYHSADCTRNTIGYYEQCGCGPADELDPAGDGETRIINGEIVPVERMPTSLATGEEMPEPAGAQEVVEQACRAFGAHLSVEGWGDAPLGCIDDEALEAAMRTGTDRYGRTLARLTVDGRDVGTVLVSMGLARPWRGRREGWC